MIKRTRLVFGFGLLLTVWVMVAAWQVVEHVRVKESARAALINRSRDITTTLGLVIRSQRRFGGMVSQERLEPALGELVKSGELSSVALLNAAGEVVASAGAPIDVETKGTMRTGEHWDSRSVTLVNLVDLGASVAQEGETNRPTIVLPRREPGSGPREGDRPRPSGEMPPPPDGELRTNGPLASNAPTSLGERGRIQIIGGNAGTARFGDRHVHGGVPVGLCPGPLVAVHHRVFCQRCGRWSRIGLAKPGKVGGVADAPAPGQRVEYPSEGDESGRGRTGARNAQSAEYHSRAGANDLQTEGGADGSSQPFP